MPRLLTLTTLFTLLAATTHAQTLNEPGPDQGKEPSIFKLPCGGDLLLDDFSEVRTWNAPNGETKRLNALDGDWGIYGGDFTIDPVAKTMTITPAPGPETYPPDVHNPNTVPTNQWFYTQFSSQKELFDKACVNLTPFSALRFEAIAPAGFDFNITYTQRQSGDCSVRIFDSQYKLFSDYYKTPNEKATITLPFSDFATDLGGNPFNYEWNKDLTFINMHAAKPGESIIISNVWLVGKPCPGASTTAGPSASATSATATATGTGAVPSPTKAVEPAGDTNAAAGVVSGGWAALAGAVAVIGAVAAF